MALQWFTAINGRGRSRRFHHKKFDFEVGVRHAQETIFVENCSHAECIYSYVGCILSADQKLEVSCLVYEDKTQEKEIGSCA
jgi:hypothetical protein